MKMLLILIFGLFITSCSNVSSTRMIFKSDSNTLILDMPKELETKNLKVVYDSQQGKIEITSDSWVSRNSDTIQAQASREKAFLEGGSVLIEKATEGAVKGAMKGIVP